MRTFRPDIDAGSESFLYAAAMNPHGSLAATAGMDRRLYLFERESGRLVRGIEQPSAILHVDYSADGRYLIVALAGKKGCHIYEAPHCSRVETSQDIEGSTHYAAMQAIMSSLRRRVCPTLPVRCATKWISTAISTATIRRRIPSFCLIQSDGEHIAIGFAKTSRIDILTTVNLATVQQPDIGDCDRPVIALAWSMDGARLYGGGACQKGQGRTIIRAWNVKDGDD